MTQPVISIKNMSKNYDSVNVINGLNWQIQPGEIIALLGNNGAGKTTLMECMMNIRQFETGELKLWGYSWDELPQEYRVKIAYVSQEIQGFEWMKVKDFIVYLGGFFPSFDKQYATSLMYKWNLIPDKQISELSKGQKQILHVIQAFSVKPELLILDEPVAHLDSNIRRKFMAELIDLAYENNTTVIFSSHIISDIERVASKVALVKDKNIAVEYDLDNLKSSIAHLKIAADMPLEQIDYFKEAVNWHSYAQGATAKITQPLSNGLEDFIKHSPYNIEYTPMSLEDWYVEMNSDES